MAESITANRNIVLVTVDSLQADYCYDADVPTPAIDALADHGEAFGEHGRFGHGGLLYEENVRVPLVVGNIGNRPNVTRPISLRTIPRLITGLSDGGVATSETRRAYATSENGDLCIRGPWWKYYARDDGSDELYDHRTDPDERAAVETDIEALRERYRARLREIGAVKTAAREGVTLERL